MTILLIERCGRVHELEIPMLVLYLYVPLVNPDFWARQGAQFAIFELSPEYSYPPVYRWVA